MRVDKGKMRIQSYIAVLVMLLPWPSFLAAGESGTVKVEKAFEGITFQRPLDLQQPAGRDDIFVVEQEGRIYRVSKKGNAWQKTLFLDLGERVSHKGNEEGLLGLAFHPGFQENGYFFLNYSAADPRRTKIVRLKYTGVDPVDAAGEELVLEFDQPYSNHNGGQILFGPDGYLYIAVGDGGSGGDPRRHGQNRRTLLGSILRIDVNRLPYAIPPDNPFAGNKSGFREEIFAYGLRNPWRFSFHPQTGALWAADVGQNKYEEIDIIVKGGNYGWNIMEGLHCFLPPYDCGKKGLILPVFEYDHSVGQSITGGYFYTRDDIPSLKNKYIYGDFVAGKIWALAYDGKKVVSNTLISKEVRFIASFGRDNAGNLYVLSFDGNIYRLGA